MLQRQCCGKWKCCVRNATNLRSSRNSVVFGRSASQYVKLIQKERLEKRAPRNYELVQTDGTNVLSTPCKNLTTSKVDDCDNFHNSLDIFASNCHRRQQRCERHFQKEKEFEAFSILSRMTLKPNNLWIRDGHSKIEINRRSNSTFELEAPKLDKR